MPKKKVPAKKPQVPTREEIEAILALPEEQLHPYFQKAAEKIEYLEAERGAILNMVLFASMQPDEDLVKLRLVLSDIVNGRRDIREFPKEFEVRPVKTEKLDPFYMDIFQQAVASDPRLMKVRELK